MTSSKILLLAADFPEHIDGLAELLCDAVDGGASLGFAAPLAHDEAAAWWRGRSGAVADGSLLVWAAYDGDRLVGTVGLTFSPWHNGRHRAEVLKLMVHGQARGRGLGRRLLATAEGAAAAHGRTLLLLDTESDSAAEALYRSAGWLPYGVVPDYAYGAGGLLRDCTFFYKRLADGRA